MLRSTLVSIAILAVPAFAAFGITASGTKWTVDTNAGLVFTGEHSSSYFTAIWLTGGLHSRVEERRYYLHSLQ